MARREYSGGWSIEEREDGGGIFAGPWDLSIVLRHFDPKRVRQTPGALSAIPETQGQRTWLYQIEDGISFMLVSTSAPVTTPGRETIHELQIGLYVSWRVSGDFAEALHALGVR